MSTTVSRISNLPVNEEQDSKAWVEISFTPSWIFNASFKLIHLLNEEDLISVSLFGNVNSPLRPSQIVNDYTPISITLFGIVNDPKSLINHSKTNSPIIVTDSYIMLMFHLVFGILEKRMD